MNILRRVLRFFFANKLIDSILIFFIYCTGRNPLLFVYNLRGISKWQNDLKSGEHFLIKKYLPNYFKKADLTMFDVGANIGNYSAKLSNFFPDASIYSFEPNPTTFKILENKVAGNKKIKCFPFGFGDAKCTTKIFSYSSAESSEHASLYKSAITDLRHDSEVVSFDILLEKLDDFCVENKISKIDFLKIDTEGHELAVLKGAATLLKNKQIELIQFEFNEMNVLSRTFLKDFYDLVSDNYNFYRLDSHKLIELGAYNTINEIFQFQNIILIKK